MSITDLNCSAAWQHSRGDDSFAEARCVAIAAAVSVGGVISTATAYSKYSAI